MLLLLIAPNLLPAYEPNTWAAFGLQFVACLIYADVIFFSDWGMQPVR